MDDALRSKLDDLENALAETITQMGNPDLVSDQDRFAAVGRRHSELKPVVDAYHQYQAAEEERAFMRAVMNAATILRRRRWLRIPGFRKVDTHQ